MPFHALLRSEWTKLRSIRSTWWCTALYLLVVGGTGWLAAASTDTAPRSDVALGVALTGFGVGQLVVLVLGVLAVTTEFASGMAQVSLTVAPRRTRAACWPRRSSSPCTARCSPPSSWSCAPRRRSR